MKRWLMFAVQLSFVFALVQPCFSQSTEDLKSLKDEVKALKEGQTAIQKELQEIKGLLSAKQAPSAPAEFKETTLSIEGQPFKGDKNARIALIEFSDFQ